VENVLSVPVVCIIEKLDEVPLDGGALQIPTGNLF